MSYSHEEPRRLKEVGTRAVLSRIACNSTWLIVRTAVGLVVGLIAVRLAVSGLGVSDYGLYAAVFGVVAFVSMFNGILREAMCRFLGTARGRDGSRGIRLAYPPALGFCLLIALGAVVCGEIGGLYSIRHFLGIPAGRESAAGFAFHAGIVTVMAQILSLPFVARIITGERMRVFLFVGLLEQGFELLAAVAVLKFSQFGLKAYSGVLAAENVIVLLFYAVYCFVRYKDVRVRPSFARNAIRPIWAFFGWSMLGAFGNVVKYQWVCLLIGRISGVTHCASWAVAIRIWSFFYAFGADFQQAFSPALYKSWADGSNRFGYLVSCAVITNMVLVGGPAVIAFIFARAAVSLWLGEDLPPQLVLFVRCALVNLIADVISQPLTTAINASGRIVLYQVVVILLSIVGFVSAWALLSAGFGSWTALAAVAGINVVSCGYRLFHVRCLLPLAASRRASAPSLVGRRG